MAGRGGNLNPTGRSGYTNRPKGGLVSITFDVAGMERLAVRRMGEVRRADTAIFDTHRQLAALLQDYVADELRRAIKAGGRGQRPAQRLMKALVDERNRRVNLKGFTVGFLDEAWAGEVSQYYRGLEVGTAVHVGRYLRGSFQDRSGRLVRPIEGGKDPRFLQFGPTGPLQADGTFGSAGNRRNSLHQGSSQGPRMASGKFSSGAGFQGQIPGVRIKNPITGYHYFARGKKAFTADRLHSQVAIEEYVLNFQAHGIDFLARALSRGMTSMPRIGTRGFTSRPASAEPGR